MASARLSAIVRLVFMRLDQGRRAAGVDQCPSPARCSDAEISKPLIWRGLERCRAACRHRLDAVPVRWRTALVCVFGCCKRSVLRSPRHQAVQGRAPVRLLPLLSACLCEPTGIGPSAGAWEITKDPNTAGRKPEHA